MPVDEFNLLSALNSDERLQLSKGEDHHRSGQGFISISVHKAIDALDFYLLPTLTNPIASIDKGCSNKPLVFVSRLFFYVHKFRSHCVF